MAVVVVLCVWCGVCRDTLKNSRVYIQNVPVCTGTKPTCVKHVGVVPVHTGRLERTHGEAFDAYTPSSSLDTHNDIQQHTTTEHSTTKDNRQLTTTSTRSETKHQPPATAHLSEHETQAKKPTQDRQLKQPKNTSTRENERRDTSPEPRDNRQHNTTERQQTHKERQRQTHETPHQRHTRPESHKTRQDDQGDVHI